jgi:hypothetical protein
MRLGRCTKLVSRESLRLARVTDCTVTCDTSLTGRKCTKQASRVMCYTLHMIVQCMALESMFIDQAILNGTRPNSASGVKPARQCMARHLGNERGMCIERCVTLMCNSLPERGVAHCTILCGTVTSRAQETHEPCFTNDVSHTGMTVQRPAEQMSGASKLHVRSMSTVRLLENRTVQ